METAKLPGKPENGRDPPLSKHAGIYRRDGPAHGETQAPLRGSGCSSAGGRPVLQPGVAKLGLRARSKNVQRRSDPTFRATAREALSLEPIHVLVAGPSLFANRNPQGGRLVTVVENGECAQTSPRR